LAALVTKYFDDRAGAVLVFEDESHTFLHGTLCSTVFAFIDDVFVQCVVRNASSATVTDASQTLTLNLQSQSRIGYSDFGQNLVHIREILDYVKNK